MEILKLSFSLRTKNEGSQQDKSICTIWLVNGAISHK